MKLNDQFTPIRGILEFTERCKATGEIINHDRDDNVFLRLGMSHMIQAFTNPAPVGGVTSNIIQSLRIGDDVGDGGTQLNPIPATDTMQASDQNVIFTINYSDFTVSYPDFYSVVYTTVIDGDVVMANYPQEVDKRFTSAALYTGDNQPAAYRRFEARTISRQVTIDVKWTLLFTGQNPG